MSRFLSRCLSLAPQALALLRATMLCALLPGAPALAADAWPAKPIRMIVPFPAGGGTDIVARDITLRLSGLNHWVFVIDNKPGSGGGLGLDAAAKSAPDGYTLVVGQTSNVAINPALYDRLPYNPVRDFAPVALIGRSPLALVVAASSPYRTLADLLQDARAHPSELNVATSGNGTVAHLTAEMLQREAGVKLTHVPYRGAMQGLNDVLGGQIQLYISSVPTLISHIRAGKLRALAVTSLQRVADLPQVPTVAEQGYPGFESSTWFGVMGPAGLPAAVVNTVNAEVNRALTLPALKSELEGQGLVLNPSSSEEFARLIRADITRWGQVVKASGARAD